MAARCAVSADHGRSTGVAKRSKTKSGQSRVFLAFDITPEWDVYFNCAGAWASPAGVVVLAGVWCCRYLPAVVCQPQGKRQRTAALHDACALAMRLSFYASSWSAPVLWRFPYDSLHTLWCKWRHGWHGTTSISVGAKWRCRDRIIIRLRPIRWDAGATSLSLPTIALQNNGRVRETRFGRLYPMMFSRQLGGAYFPFFDQ